MGGHVACGMPGMFEWDVGSSSHFSVKKPGEEGERESEREGSVILFAEDMKEEAGGCVVWGRVLILLVRSALCVLCNLDL